MPPSRGFLAAAAALTAAVAVAAPAHASPTQESVFMDDNLLLYRGDDTADSTLRELADLGVDRVRVSVPWVLFAPDAGARTRTATPHYQPAAFDHHDHLVRVAKQLGIKVLFNITGGAALYKPSAAQFGRFVEMLGTRYDGKHADENQGASSLPRVDTWSVWNEPNTGAHLQPQWQRSKATGGWVPVAARIYRDLARAAIAGLQRSGHGGDTILLGETAPLGLNVRGRTRSIRPVTFLDALLCLDPRTHRALRGRAAAQLGCNDFRSHGELKVSGYAHHPYSVTSAPDVADPNPREIRLADRDRLGTLLDAGAALHRLPANLTYWWTEFGWQTKPPDPIRGVALADQARWIAQAEQITRADPRTAALTQFLLRDDLPRDSSDPSVRWGTYQTGLEDSAGNHKPAYDAYRLPLVATRTGAGVALWGLVRPTNGAATVQVQFAPSGSEDFQPVGGPVSVDRAARAFTVDVTPDRSGSYRFTWSGPQPPTPPRTSLFSPPKAPPAPLYTSLVVSVKVG
jgi:hypothetical protein